LILFLISLKSPLYVSVIFFGISPQLILSIYPAVVLIGFTNASINLLISTISSFHPPLYLELSPLVSSLPSSVAFIKFLTSYNIPLTAVTVFFIAGPISSLVSFMSILIFKSPSDIFFILLTTLSLKLSAISSIAFAISPISSLVLILSLLVKIPDFISLIISTTFLSGFVITPDIQNPKIIEIIILIAIITIITIIALLAELLFWFALSLAWVVLASTIKSISSLILVTSVSASPYNNFLPSSNFLFRNNCSTFSIATLYFFKFLSISLYLSWISLLWIVFSNDVKLLLNVPLNSSILST